MFCQRVQCLSCVNAMMNEPVLQKQDKSDGLNVCELLKEHNIRRASY